MNMRRKLLFFCLAFCIVFFLFNNCYLNTGKQNRAPVAHAGEDQEVIKEEKVYFDGSGSTDPDGDELSYSWDFGEESTGTGANPSHVYSTEGYYTVNLTVSDDEGLEDSDSILITVISTSGNHGPIAQAGADQYVETGDTVNFDGSGSSDPDGDTLSYSWDFDDGSTGSGATPSHVYNSAGTYKVILTVSDASGLKGNDQINITVSEATQKPKIIIDHSAIEEFDNLTSEQIQNAKKVLMLITGESHGRAYGYGLKLIESQDSTFAASTTWSGEAEAYRDDALRWHYPFLNGESWDTRMGEEDFWTNDTAKAARKNALTSITASYSGRIIFGMVWCWDMERNGVTTDKDPVYSCGWAGSTVGGPDGDEPWGIDEDDNSITGNRLNLGDYLTAVEEYQVHAPTIHTIFTTGTVDDDAQANYLNSETGYQRWLKNEAIRNYVEENGGLLFDYSDILSYDYETDSRFTESWSGNSWNGANPDFISSSYDGGQGGCHITAEACRIIGKALWVLAVRYSEIAD